MNNLFNGIYNGKKVFITGNTGFKGTWLSIWLKSLGAEVMGYSLKTNTYPSMFDSINSIENINTIYGDIRNYEFLYKSINDFQPDIIFHLAAQPLVRYSYNKPLETYEVNVIGTANVLEAARFVESVKSVVIITTDKCYENKEWVYGYRENDPMGGYDPYSSSKGCAELVTSAYRNSFYNNSSIGLASARAGNVIGGGDWAEDRLIPDFVKATISEKDILIRNPKATRPWQHVLEPLSGYLWLGASMMEDKEKFNSGWNFGPRDSDVRTVKEILELSIEAWGKGKYVIDCKEQPHEANLLKLDISKAGAILGWQPVYPVEIAINQTIEWYRNFYDKNEDILEFTIKQIENYIENARKQNIGWSVN
ncbi:CDP-glucose 4,6-dehydratase [Clostridium intestinale]|uniref:CDP-glucose 4,6-dehydratase n=1 Tax=Clostridium intestinale TaxID=36845 RepID=A0A7D7ACE5_9CLOT|nr:CDP-glucose 4,6-dehydratase [Clostridium intestinale]QLY79124.1 CDP-glucose 4,6-dehydratase [Clostridium intestinale]